MPKGKPRGTPKYQTIKTNRKKFQLMYPFGWSWEKALPPEHPRRPEGRKQWTRSLIRSRRRGPNTVCIFPQNLNMSLKTPLRVSILDPIVLVWQRVAILLHSSRFVLLLASSEYMHWFSARVHVFDLNICFLLLEIDILKF